VLYQGKPIGRVASSARQAGPFPGPGFRVDRSGADHAEQIHGVTEGLTQSPPRPEEALEREGFQGALHKAIAKLPERERIIIERTYFDGATLGEVGAELGVNESRVCQLRTQAVARLKAGLLGD